ncbi:MAG TPA: AMP-binding protein [Burkholderiales bacterium]|nr:AMP-binding protein [Burkholderiales bacterium]
MPREEARARLARVARERAVRYRASGAWRDASIGDAFLAACSAREDDVVLFDRDEAIAFRELRERVLRLAVGLAAIGVRPGDAVAYQLPNWWEAAAALLATSLAGACAVPIVPILRTREVSFILDQTRPRALLVPARHRDVDHAAQAEAASAALGRDRPVIVVVRGSAGAPSGATSFESLLANAPASARDPRVPIDPDSPAVVIYTSGSTADPKGAVHSHNTLSAEVASLVAAHALGARDRVLMPSPLTHVSGVVHGILCPALLGTSAVLMERWDAGAGIAAIERQRVTYMIGAPTFLQEILAHPDVARRDLSSLRLYSCGGATVPPELLRAARSRLPGMVAKRVYGSSEFPTIATTTAEDAAARGLDTEGRPLAGVEIRITDERGRALPAGAEGEIRARGPDCFLGYTDPALDAESFDRDGFFRTGDLGVQDAEGYLRITGRVKDIIVRKGEKLSAREIEDLLSAHPAVAEVAVVPVADRATGERACACVRLRAGADAPTLAALVDFLRARDLTPQKLPEQLEIIDDFPRTPSGKVHKRFLREQIEAKAARAGA